jgi:carboxylesterase type B
MTGFRTSALITAMLLFMCFSAAPAVKVKGGLFEGTAEEGQTVYRGIPFAARSGGLHRRRLQQTKPFPRRWPPTESTSPCTAIPTAAACPSGSEIEL